MKYYINNFLVLILLIPFIACNRHDSESIRPTIETEEPIEYFDSHFIGLVTDENQQALSDCIIEINGNVTSTYNNGIFLMAQTKTNKVGSIVTVKKQGYFDQYLYTITKAQAISNLHFDLIKKNIFAKINSTQSNTIALENNISLTLPANAFATPSSSPYNGQINIFYNNKNTQLKNIPFIFNNLKSTLIENGTVIDIKVEDISGNPLILTKPITLEVTNMTSTIGMLDLTKDRWQEIESINITKTRTLATIEKFSPIIVGMSTPKTLITSKIKIANNINPTYIKAEIIDASNQTYTNTITQDGTLQFYLPQDHEVIIYLKDFCNNIIETKSFKSSNKTSETIPDITLPDTYFKTLSSEIKPCEEPINIADMVYAIYEVNGQTSVQIQTSNVQNMSLPTCMILKKVTYFRGTQKLYSINLDQSVNNSSTIYLGSNLFCVPKLSGIIKINNTSIILNSDQYKIYREGASHTNLTISNYTGFVISIDNATKAGKYKATGVIFNNPTITDCLDDECKDLTIEIKKIGNVGELVSLTVNGTINGLSLKGEFTNKLSM